MYGGAEMISQNLQLQLRQESEGSNLTSLIFQRPPHDSLVRQA